MAFVEWCELRFDSIAEADSYGLGINWKLGASELPCGVTVGRDGPARDPLELVGMMHQTLVSRRCATAPQLDLSQAWLRSSWGAGDPTRQGRAPGRRRQRR